MEPLLAAKASGGVCGGGEAALLEGVAAAGDGDKVEEPHSERG